MRSKANNEFKDERENTWNSCAVMHPKWTIIHGTPRIGSNAAAGAMRLNWTSFVDSFCGLSVTIRKWCIILLALASTHENEKKTEDTNSNGHHFVEIIICSFHIVKIMAESVISLCECVDERVCFHGPCIQKCIYYIESALVILADFKCLRKQFRQFQIVYKYVCMLKRLTNWQQFIIWMRLFSQHHTNTNHANNL